MLFYLIAMVVVIFDQIAKILVRMHIPLGQDIVLWNIHLTHYENTGMAGSMFQGYARLFGVIAILFVVGVMYYRRKPEFRGRFMDIIAGFFVGGAIGNGIDRLAFGQVTDFLVSRSGRGILNFADHAINIGAVLLILYVLTSFVKKKMCASH
ncbi:signal peptidase II [Paenibacillus selenitireducens]|uniref:Lipoprotein signal peptidase n=1 Tax=Paenibacillus selenitireducens TaxID=1324314 RepID=A0A1T2X289_9BACL|nr:signal peptidase II [Paenibacillus selenitireducens]OPA73979.1 signal peptidase II [Paenibacillus selenitireducens]